MATAPAWNELQEALQVEPVVQKNSKGTSITNASILYRTMVNFLLDHPNINKRALKQLLLHKSNNHLFQSVATLAQTLHPNNNHTTIDTDAFLEVIVQQTLLRIALYNHTPGFGRSLAQTHSKKVRKQHAKNTLSLVQYDLVQLLSLAALKTNNIRDFLQRCIPETVYRSSLQLPLGMVWTAFELSNPYEEHSNHKQQGNHKRPNKKRPRQTSVSNNKENGKQPDVVRSSKKTMNGPTTTKQQQPVVPRRSLTLAHNKHNQLLGAQRYVGSHFHSHHRAVSLMISTPKPKHQTKRRPPPQRRHHTVRVQETPAKPPPKQQQQQRPTSRSLVAQAVASLQRQSRFCSQSK